MRILAQCRERKSPGCTPSLSRVIFSDCLAGLFGFFLVLLSALFSCSELMPIVLFRATSSLFSSSTCSMTWCSWSLRWSVYCCPFFLFHAMMEIVGIPTNLICAPLFLSTMFRALCNCIRISEIAVLLSLSLRDSRPVSSSLSVMSQVPPQK